MGLIDVLNGMQNGPHGPRGRSTKQQWWHVADDHGDPRVSGLQGGEELHRPAERARLGTDRLPLKPKWRPRRRPRRRPEKRIGRSVGRRRRGQRARAAVSSDLLKQFQQSGQGDKAKSWVSNGPNKPVSSGDLAKALGADQINTLMTHTGLSREDLLAGLSQQLPDAVNQLTPDGRLPTEQEVARSI